MVMEDCQVSVELSSVEVRKRRKERKEKRKQMGRSLFAAEKRCAGIEPCLEQSGQRVQWLQWIQRVQSVALMRDAAREPQADTTQEPITGANPKGRNATKKKKGKWGMVMGLPGRRGVEWQEWMGWSRKKKEEKRKRK